MPQQVKISVRPNGTIAFLWDDSMADLRDLGSMKIRRASHVEPTDDGHWTADMGPVDGPILGPYASRAEALAAEVLWVEAFVLGGKP